MKPNPLAPFPELIGDAVELEGDIRLAQLAEALGRPRTWPARARTLLGWEAPAGSPVPFSDTIILDEAEEAIAG